MIDYPSWLFLVAYAGGGIAGLLCCMTIQIVCDWLERREDRRVRNRNK